MGQSRLLEDFQLDPRINLRKLILKDRSRKTHATTSKHCLAARVAMIRG